MQIPFWLRARDKLAKFYFSIKASIKNYFDFWIPKLLKFYMDFRKTWVHEHIVFIIAYGLLLDFVASVLFGQPFSVLRIFAYGIAYYFFRFELFYWIRGIKG